jgi:hypothetical protein
MAKHHEFDKNWSEDTRSVALTVPIVPHWFTYCFLLLFEFKFELGATSASGTGATSRRTRRPRRSRRHPSRRSRARRRSTGWLSSRRGRRRGNKLKLSLKLLRLLPLSLPLSNSIFVFCSSVSNTYFSLFDEYGTLLVFLLGI